MKTHLRANKEKPGILNYACCASKIVSQGMINKNNRNTYLDIDQKYIVDILEFEKTPENQRCSHCMNIGLERRNKQRKLKGLQPVKSLFEKA